MASLAELQGRISRLKWSLLNPSGDAVGDSGREVKSTSVAARSSPIAKPIEACREHGADSGSSVADNPAAWRNDPYAPLVAGMVDLQSAITAGSSSARSMLMALAGKVVRWLDAVDQPPMASELERVESMRAPLAAMRTALVAGYLARSDRALRRMDHAIAACALTMDASAPYLAGFDFTVEMKPDARASAELHPAASARIADRLLNLPDDWRQAIAEHHESLDGSGFPHRRGANELSVAGKLLATASRYVALRTPQSGRKALSAKQALKACLLEGERGLLDRAWTSALLSLGFYEPGTAVELSTGERAVVVCNQQARFDPAWAALPVVRLTHDAAGRRRETPQYRNLAALADVRIVRAPGE